MFMMSTSSEPARRMRHAVVTYEFTSDPDLLEQYTRIKAELHSDEYGDFEKEMDALGLMLIARVGGRCVGGARILHKDIHSRLRLPIEGDDFRLAERLPELSLEQHPYCEFSRLILLPDYQTGDHSLAMLQRMTQKAKELRCAFIFGETTPSKARRYRRIYRQMGLELTIREDIKTPDREIYRHYDEPLDLRLVYVDLRRPAKGGDDAHA
jgi:hypothetical protein